MTPCLGHLTRSPVGVLLPASVRVEPVPGWVLWGLRPEVFVGLGVGTEQQPSQGSAGLREAQATGGRAGNGSGAWLLHAHPSAHRRPRHLSWLWGP